MVAIVSQHAEESGSEELKSGGSTSLLARRVRPVDRCSGLVVREGCGLGQVLKSEVLHRVWRHEISMVNGQRHHQYRFAMSPDTYPFDIASTTCSDACTHRR